MRSATENVDCLGVQNAEYATVVLELLDKAMSHMQLLGPEGAALVAQRLQAALEACHAQFDVVHRANGTTGSKAMGQTGCTDSARLREDTTSSSLSVTHAVPRPQRILLAAPLQEAKPPWHQLLTKEFWNPSEAQTLKERNEAATRIQCRLRKRAILRWYRDAREIFAIVSNSEELNSSVTAYTITVLRCRCCWQVTHRFSEWRAMHLKLSPMLIQPPSFPSRVPFGGSFVRSRRQFALNRYLQQVLPLTDTKPLARAIILSFLTRSHMYWEYTSPPRKAMIAAADCFDRSTGNTAASAVIERGGGVGSILSPGAFNDLMQAAPAQSCVTTTLASR
mmetsp:Transcript_20156/g.33462  ORF Transcript_20156/g.33462 Transcript_20156/m.33462 type:complete len:336 (+) Transcript_20156:166-1173(+)|eukprot:CAMPEP_0119339362 /NCGR_PEP_ID=MMETSP1333-20130426/98088_1 /TAXON_ID=418940 /ORGANISM="Scyphosphaera apsteinii, Strain RCC1455" /LENGTH=335 /DNA_ID=CAMNT_0007350865 /DNA_START=153 /DNA_END=1160 /DNA_ORIENTATION=-